MKKWRMVLPLGGMLVASACETNQPQGETVAAGAVIPQGTHADRFEGAAVDAPIAGLAGAVWSDPNNTGYVTGYTYKGEYHPGTPPGYDIATHSVATGTHPADM